MDTEDFWKSFIDSSSPVDQLREDKISVVPQGNPRQFKKDSEISEADSEMVKSRPKSSTPVKRNKWKPEEVTKLISMRGQLNRKFEVAKKRMALWEEISMSLLADGFNRSPGQCKSLWASLVQKYQVCAPQLLENF